MGAEEQLLLKKILDQLQGSPAVTEVDVTDRVSRQLGVVNSITNPITSIISGGVDVTDRGDAELINYLSIDVTDILYTSVIDTDNGFLYIGTETNPGYIIKIRLSDFTYIDYIQTDHRLVQTSVIDTNAGFAYFGCDTSPAKILKIRLSDFTQVGTITPPSGEDNIVSAVIDTNAGFAYFGCDTSPAKIIKIRLSDFTRVDVLTLNAGEEFATTAIIDTNAGFAYFGLYTTPTIVVKVRLSDFTRVSALTFDAGEDKARSAVIDTKAGWAYFGTYNTITNVVRVRLSDFTREDAIIIDPDGWAPRCATIDTTNGYAYFGLDKTTNQLVKVRLSDFSVLTYVSFGSSNISGLRSAAIDVNNGFAYFGDYNYNVLKVAISPLRRIGMVYGSQEKSLLQRASTHELIVQLSNAGTEINPAALKQTSSRTPINIAGAGDNTILAAVAAKKHKIVKMVFICAAPVDIIIKSGANSLTGLMSFSTNGGMTFDGDFYPLEMNTNEAFIINLSGAVQVSGWIEYFTE